MTDGGLTDGGMTDGGLTDGEMTDGEMTDGEMTDGGLTDGEMTDGEMTDGEMTDGEMTDGDALGHGSCEEALETLYSYLDGELTEDRRRQIQTHLTECSPCLGAFDFEAELKAVVARRCRDQVPEHLRRKVAAVLAEASGAPLRAGDLGPSSSGLGDEH